MTDNETLLKIKNMLKELGWSDEIINTYCEECVRNEQNVPVE